MKQFLVFIIFLLAQCFIVTFTWGQDPEIDSARAAVDSYPYRDSIKVQQLVELTKYYSSRDISKNPPLIQEALQLAKEIGYRKGVGMALNVQSKHFIVIGELDKALPAALESKRLFDSLGYQAGLIGTNNNLARIYNVNGEFENSLAIHLENIQLVKDEPASADKAGMYFYVAKSYESLERYDSAESNYLRALDISKASNFQTGVAIAEGSLGGIYNNLGLPEEAIKYLLKTLKYSEQNHHHVNVAASSFSLAQSYMKLDQYAEALKYIERSTAIYEELRNYRMLKDCYFTQTSILERLGRHEEALKYLKLHVNVKDSVFSESKMKVVEELQAKYETEKKEAEIESLSQKSQIQELQLQNQQYGLVALGVLLILIIGGGFLLSRQRRLKEEQRLTFIELEETKKRLEVEKQFRESELKALRSQMNPHFVFNALNSIQEYIMMNEKRLAGKYLGKFADLMRTYLDHSQRKAVTVHEEVEALVLYLELEKLRFEDSLSFTVHTDPELDADEVKLPALLLQPFVENAIKHGLLHKRGERRLEVLFQRENDFLMCIIEDNGVGRKASADINKNRSASHNSYATGAIQERISLINYSLHLPLQVETIDLENESGLGIGTRVIIRIPVEAFSSSLV